MMIQQISVFLENCKGALCELTGLLGGAGVDLMALAVADTANFGIVRCIVKEDQLQKTTALLTENGYTSRVSHVVCVCVPDRPAGLYEVLSMLEKEGISVEYMYSFIRSASHKALLILRLSDNEQAVSVFEKNGVQMLSQTEVNQL